MTRYYRERDAVFSPLYSPDRGISHNGTVEPAFASGGDKAYVVEINGAIGPVTEELVERGIDSAEGDGTMVILQMDTPGGLDHSMREIIKAILDAHVPVITYVSPQGSRAASAGTYILYSSHVAAMAPATNLGAATPVQIGGLPKLPTDPTRPATEDEADDGKTSMERKIINDASAYMKFRRSLADVIAPLLPAVIQFHDKATLDAFNRVWTELTTQIKGDPWKLSGRGITQHRIPNLLR